MFTREDYSNQFPLYSLNWACNNMQNQPNKEREREREGERKGGGERGGGGGEM